MSFVSFLKGVFNKMLGRNEITRPFNVKADINSKMYEALGIWDDLFVNSKTQLASIIAGEAARLATIDMSITVSGGSRAEAIQSIINSNRDRLRSKLELGCAYGGLIIKPNKNGLDFIPASRYIPISYDGNGNISSVIFIDKVRVSDTRYTRLEYHRLENINGNTVYIIENKAFKSKDDLYLGSEIRLTELDNWKDIEPYVELMNVEKPLFGYFRMPMANNVDIDSPLGVSIFSKAVESIKDFDMWYSKWKREGKLSDKYLFVNEQAMMKPGATGKDKAVAQNPVPELIKGLQFGNNASKCIEEWSPSIRVDEFKQALQTQLDLISMQCGFSSGYLSFDERTGAVTATQIQSEDQRTNSTCTDIQQNYKLALEGAIYALNVFMSLYEDYDDDDIDVTYYMKDLYVNAEEDRNRAYQLAQNGYIPKWKYLVDYEGYSEEEAKSLVAEAESNNESKHTI